jgi:hypothetical protein
MLAWCRPIRRRAPRPSCEGHNVSFEFFGGVPRSILYDDTKLAVARILGDGTRQRTRVLSELQSHYLFATSHQFSSVMVLTKDLPSQSPCPPETKRARG